MSSSSAAGASSAAGGAGAGATLRSKCSACGKLSAVAVCVVCKSARYCDKACQRADWRRHKTMCKAMAASALAPAPAAVAAVSCACAVCALQTAANAAPAALRMRVAHLPDAAAAAACLRAPLCVRAESDDALIPALTQLGPFYMQVLAATGRKLPCAALAGEQARQRMAWRAALAACRDALHAGADAHASRTIVHEGNLPLHLPSMLWMACRMGSLELFRVVAEHSRAALDLTLCTNDAAATIGIFPVVHGARDFISARTLLFAAMEAGSVPLVKALLERGADVAAASAPDVRGKDALTAAFQLSHAGAPMLTLPLKLELMEALVACGLDLDAPIDADGTLLLHALVDIRPLAAGRGSVGAATQLFRRALELGADASARACAPSAPGRAIDDIVASYARRVYALAPKSLPPGSVKRREALAMLVECACALQETSAGAATRAIDVPAYRALAAGTTFAGTANYAVDAATMGFVGAVDVALRSGMSPDFQAAGGRPILYLAAAVLSADSLVPTDLSGWERIWRDKLECVTALLSAGANPLVLRPAAMLSGGGGEGGGSGGGGRSSVGSGGGGSVDGGVRPAPPATPLLAIEAVRVNALVFGGWTPLLRRIAAVLDEAANAWEARHPGAFVDLAKSLVAVGADYGNLDYAYDKAVELHSGSHGAPWDTEGACTVWRILADAGHTNSVYNLASMYEGFDCGVPHDSARAAELYATAAAAGDARAMTNLAVLHTRGDGVTHDGARAAQLLEDAIRLNDPAAQGNAQNALAALYFAGDGVPHDADKATALWEAAAQAGNATAHRNLFQVACMLERAMKEAHQRATAAAAARFAARRDN